MLETIFTPTYLFQIVMLWRMCACYASLWTMASDVLGGSGPAAIGATSGFPADGELMAGWLVKSPPLEHKKPLFKPVTPVSKGGYSRLAENPECWSLKFQLDTYNICKKIWSYLLTNHVYLQIILSYVQNLYAKVESRWAYSSIRGFLDAWPIPSKVVQRILISNAYLNLMKPVFLGY